MPSPPATRGPGLPVDEPWPPLPKSSSPPKTTIDRPMIEWGPMSFRACPRCARCRSVLGHLQIAEVAGHPLLVVRAAVVPREGIKDAARARQTLAEITKNVDVDAVEPRRQAADRAVDHCGPVWKSACVGNQPSSRTTVTRRWRRSQPSRLRTSRRWRVAPEFDFHTAVLRWAG